tara:strand:- start:4530 stop:5690 length:1161 start_codon:yes stop_codon:yes gene_type:complete
MSVKKYIFIVQVTRQLSIDILNRFVDEGAEIELVTGIVESNYAPLHPQIKVTTFNKYDNTSTFKRMFTWLVFTVLSFFYVLFNNRNKELIIITTPPFIIFLGSFFYRLRKQKYHLIIWDLYPDVLVNFGVLKKTSWVLKRWVKLNEKCFGAAENIFTLGEHLSDAILKYSGKIPVIIPNWVNTDFVKPVDKSTNSFAIKHGLTNKLVVMYSGNLGLTHDIESIIETADYLRGNEEIHFVIIGEGAKKTKIEQLVKDKKLNNVLMLTYQDKEVLPYSLSCADIGVVTLSQGAEMISVPSKTYYTLAAGSVILALASNQSELGLLIEKHNCGKVFEVPQKELVGEFIQELLKNKEKLISYKENARKASYNFTPENAKSYYDYIYDKSI